MDLTYFWEVGRSLGIALPGMLAASLLGAVIGAWAPWAAYRSLREEALDDGAFDPGRALRSKTLVFQAAAMTGVPYGIEAAFFMVIQRGSEQLSEQMPRLLAAVCILGAANLVCGVLKGILAGRQIKRIAKEPQWFSRGLVVSLLPEVPMLLALVLYMTTALRLQ